jgi:exosortase F-associated protein
MNKWVRIFIIGLLVILLMLVRAYGARYFYDPFIIYFRHDYLTTAVPEYQTVKLFLNLFLRYSINSGISLAIIYFAFLKRDLVMFSVKFLILAFIVLSFFYFVLLNAEMLKGYLFAFYVRRFLIHPIFVLILLPAFYYQKKFIIKSK